ncbi:MAG: hypothetical protein KGM44_04460 [bacterium]|nr:hypothetical protein [bacterium]
MSKAEIMDGFQAVTTAIEIAFRRLDDRITSVQAELQKEMRAGFARIDRRLARLDDRQSAVESRLAVVEADVSTLKADVSTLKADVSELRVDMSMVKERLASSSG